MEVRIPAARGCLDHIFRRPREAHADSENPIGPEVHRRAQGGRKANAAIGEVTSPDVHRREENGDRRGGHDMVNRESLPNAKAVERTHGSISPCPSKKVIAGTTIVGCRQSKPVEKPAPNMCPNTVHLSRSVSRDRSGSLTRSDFPRPAPIHPPRERSVAQPSPHARASSRRFEKCRAATFPRARRGAARHRESRPPALREKRS